MIFPLRTRPSESYHQAPRSFGCQRDAGKRQHAGCDLYAKAGDDVLAIEDGKVTRGCYLFYDVVFALEITSTDGRVIRYGEVAGAAPGIRLGSQVKAGQVIAKVGQMKAVHQAMLHLEMYSGTVGGELTDRNSPPFMRRADLLDPSEWLDSSSLLP